MTTTTTGSACGSADRRAKRPAARLALASTLILSAISIGVLQAASDGTTGAAPVEASTIRLDLAVNDIAWDAAREVLYATVGDDSPSHANLVVTIDPVSGDVLSSRSVGTQPNALAMTADGSAIYVGIDGRGAVQKFSLPDFTPGWTYTFGEYISRTMLAGDIEVMPGANDTISVSRRVNGLSPSLAGVVVIDSGVARPDMTSSHIGSNSIVFGADASTLYGSDTESSATEFQRHAIDADGITEVDVSGMGGGDLIFHDGLVYVTHGTIINPVGPTPTLADTLPGGSGVAIDAATNRIFYTVQNSAGTLSTNVTAYDLDTRTLVGEWTVPKHEGFSASLISLGNDRLAYRDVGFDEGLMLIDLSTVPTDPPSTDPPPPDPPPDPPPPKELGAIGEFTPLTPERVLDTRTGLGRGTSTIPLGAGSTFAVQITGRGGVPTSGVVAVVMNVTVTEPTAPSFLTVWPTGFPLPDISNLNYQPNQTVPNLVTVLVGENGTVNAFNRFGTAHVIFDVVGFYSDNDGPKGDRFQGIDPFRYFDTRENIGGVGTAPLGENESMSFNVLGKGGVPTTGVSAVVMNVTVTQTTAPSFLTVYPGDVGSVPEASNLNYGADTTVPNLVVVRVPDNGVIQVFNRFGSAHVIADVVGFYDDDRSTEAGRLLAVVPYRSFDTRDDDSPLGTDEWLSLQFVDEFDNPDTWIEAVVLNVTVTQPTAPSFLTVFPEDLCVIPNASNLNYVANQTVPNHVIVSVSEAENCSTRPSAIGLYNRFGSVHVIVDVFGAFTSETFGTYAATAALHPRTVETRDVDAAVRHVTG